MDLATRDNSMTGRASEPRSATRASPSSAAQVEAEPQSLETVYEQWARFVWVTLHRLGVRSADVDDVCHDVFLIVHAKLSEFDWSARMRPWLLGICARTAANYRRRARVRLEHSQAALDDHESEAVWAPHASRPDEAYARRAAAEQAERILARLGAVRRMMLIMFEVEGLSCREIADELGVPIGTVYSRLHSARKLFVAEAEKMTSQPGGRAHE